MNVALIGPNEIVCLEEFGMERLTHLTTLTCASHSGLVYQLSKDYLKKFKSEETRKSVQQLAEIKIDFMKKRLL